MAVAVECRGAWLARRPLGRACGVDLSACNASLIPRRSVPLECRLCELAWRALSDPTEALKIGFAASGPWQGECRLSPITSGDCHGVALWVEFDLGGDSRLSTCPSQLGGVPCGWIQALQLLTTPQPYKNGGGALLLNVVLTANGNIVIDAGAD